MGLFEKLKNTFFEEEYVEVDDNEEVAKKVEEKKEKVEAKKEVKPTVVDEVRNRTKVEEFDDELEELNEVVPKAEEKVLSDRELVTRTSKIEYFDDDDFVSNEYEKVEEVRHEEPRKLYGGAYGGASTNVYNINTDKKIYNKPYGASNEKGFQPTPIISPIYGVLDKNYHKDEVVDKKDRPSSYVSKKNASVDSVRQKAYGINMNTMSDLPSYEDIVSSREIEEDIEEKPLLDDMIESNKPVVDKVSIADAEQYFEDLGLEYNVDYKDAGYEKSTGRRSDRDDYQSFDNTREIIINNNIDKDDNKNDDDESELLENNLFDLVDSIYEGDE